MGLAVTPEQMLTCAVHTPLYYTDKKLR